MANKKQTNKMVVELAKLLVLNKARIATAESCTGGLISAFCTDLAGSSKWFYGTVVSYDNQAKVDILGVNQVTLDRYGAVSKETVAEMCSGLLSKTPVNFVVAVSGVAGPTGGTKVNPVGTVWIGVQKRDKLAVVNKYNFKGDREIIRYNAVEQALKNLTQLVKG